MRFVVQVCKEASVTIDNEVIARISKGEVVLVSFTNGDDEKIVDKMIDKLIKLRIFEDSNGLTNTSISSFNGEILAVSQFTLYASLKDGNRPAFANCLNANDARKLYDYFVKKLKEKYERCSFGVFQADMKVSLINDGPFTIILDSKELNYGK